MSGVRSSWLTLAKNWVLSSSRRPSCWFAALSWRLASRDLLRPPVDLDFHLAGPRAQRFGQSLLLGAALLEANEVGDVLDAVDDVFHGAARVEHRRVERAPVPLFEAASFRGRLGDVVLLDGHRVGGACLQNPLERRAQVARAGRGRILGVVGKDVEQPATEDGRPVRHGRPQIGVARGDDGEVRLQNQEQPWRCFEQQLEVRVVGGWAHLTVITRFRLQR